jgi:hypothetical protein
MSGVRITEAELLDALAEANVGDGPEDARTLNELIAEHGIARDRMLAALHVCRSQGRLVVHQVSRETLLGRRTRVPAYTILPAKKKRR